MSLTAALRLRNVRPKFGLEGDAIGDATDAGARPLGSPSADRSQLPSTATRRRAGPAPAPAPAPAPLRSVPPCPCPARPLGPAIPEESAASWANGFRGGLPRDLRCGGGAEER